MTTGFSAKIAKVALCTVKVFTLPTLVFSGLVTAMREVLAHYSVTLTQGSVHAKAMLKGISVRDARMEHTTATHTIQMVVLLASVLVDPMCAPLLLALLNPMLRSTSQKCGILMG